MKLTDKQWRHLNEGLRFGEPVEMKFHKGSLKDRPFEICKEIYYLTRSGMQIVVKPGYRTDFASIPRFFHRVFNPIGKHGHAAFVHDWLCDVTPKRCDYREAADIFGECMEFLGVNPVKRWLMVSAVKLAGPRFKKGDMK